MEKETARIEGFSDGVFAIAITLLVLELRIPEVNTIETGTQLMNFIVSQWSSYLAFSLSFFGIYVIWVNHHKLFKQIYVRNTGITFINALILFFTSLVSYPTALLARFFTTGASGISVAIYTGLFILINVSYLLLWYIASLNKQLLRPGITDTAIKQIKLDYIKSLPFYVVAFILSFIFPLIALLICMSMWIYWVVSSGKIKI